MNFFTKALALTAFVFLFALSSCNKDVCYDCTGFDDGTTSLEDTTICEGDNATEEEVEKAVDVYEALGGTCKKQ